jgi:polyphosphate glucokinase
LRFGVDIGGSGIKGAPVDLGRGRLTEKRVRIPTPRPSTPHAVADIVAEVLSAFGWQGSVGCTFPAVVKDGITLSAANVDARWVGCDADTLFTERLGMDVRLLNDADAAGLAEARYGAARDRDGVVLVLTLGTGIGSALLHDGVLVPNTELGHLELAGHEAEDRASDRARTADDLSWREYAKRLDDYLAHLERLFTPSLFVLGGGVSKHADKLLPHLRRAVEVVPATLGNDAGIIGAAMAAERPESG